MVSHAGEERDAQARYGDRCGQAGEGLHDVRGVIESVFLGVLRQFVLVKRIFQHVDNVCAARLGLAVDLGVVVPFLVERLNALLRNGEHFVAIAELQRARLARVDAGGLHALLDAVHAPVAFVDLDAVSRKTHAGVARHIVRAGVAAILASDALVRIVCHHAGFVMVERAGRADVHARRICAMHARTATECPLHRIFRIAFRFVERDDDARIVLKVGRILQGAGKFSGIQLRRRGQVVPALAGNLAPFAARAFR